MRKGHKIAVIIPALNEESAIGRVLSAIPDWVDDVIVADNGSTDRTAELARAQGAQVVCEPRRGYGAACLAGLARLDDQDIIVFLDGDYSDYPEDMDRLVDPIIDDRADFVIGSRARGEREPGALTVQARFGNWLACTLIGWLWKVRYTDLGPFRAIRHSTLRALGMRDRDYGWTVEMQIKAARKGIRILEVPVRYRRRIGRSKVSGTLKGIVGAGVKIISTILVAALDSWFREMPVHEQIIVFTRYPEPGRTKTRLIPAVGPQGAAELQRQMTEHTLRRVRALARQRPLAVEIRYEGGRDGLMSRWLGVGLSYRRQGEGDLGVRLKRAFEEAFRAGRHRVIAIGADCPGLTAELMAEAFDHLRRSDVVLGPARDGGYYLMGLRRPIPQLFDGISWGTARVLEETQEVIRRLGLSFHRLTVLDDVDRPQDLAIWDRERESAAKPPPLSRISVIIPTLNEAANVKATLGSLEGAAGVDVIIVDGGSNDETVALARSWGAKVVTSTPGRGRQMNVGAAMADGEILLFLHADTRLPHRFEHHVREILSRPGVVAGAFRLGIDAPGLGLRIIEKVANWRAQVLQAPYGDQTIFLKAEMFRHVGGYPDSPIMEDVELIRRLRRRGRIVIAPSAVQTSARRWQRMGIWKTWFVNQALILSYWVGVAPERLARWYYKERFPSRAIHRSAQTGNNQEDKHPQPLSG